MSMKGINLSFYTDNVITIDTSEVSRCVLCNDPLCTKACSKKAPVGEILRSLYFENYLGAAQKIGTTDCTYCNAPCEDACVLSRDLSPVKIRRINMGLRKCMDHLPERKTEDVDISTDICGVRLENPFLLSSSVVSSTYDMCRRAFEAGWAGASFKTICNFPQHETSPRFSSIRSHANSFCGFKNI